MPSTFFGLTIASSGLSAYQVALNTSANNISNVQTKGYSKQQANRVASESIRAYAKYGSMGRAQCTYRHKDRCFYLSMRCGNQTGSSIRL